MLTELFLQDKVAAKDMDEIETLNFETINAMEESYKIRDLEYEQEIIKATHHEKSIDKFYP